MTNKFRGLISSPISLIAICLLIVSPTTPTSAIEGVCVMNCDDGPTYDPPTYNAPAYRPSPYQLEQQRRAAARAARQRRAHQLNQQAVQLGLGHAHLQEKLKLYQEAIRLWPENKRMRANLAVVEAYIAYDAGNYQTAIDKVREAQNFDPSPDKVDTMLQWQREADQEEQQRKDAAAAKERDERQAAAAKAAVQQNVTELIESLQSPAQQQAAAAKELQQRDQAQATASLDFLQMTKRNEAQNCPFGICGNPANPDLTAPSTAAPIANPNTGAQADSNAKTGKMAATTPNSDAASNLGRSGFDTPPIVRGEQPPVVTPQGKPHGSAGLSPDNLRKLLNDKDGFKLYADEQRLQNQLNDAQKKVKEAEEKLKSAPPDQRAKVEVDVANARTQRDQVNNQLMDAQRKVEERVQYVLDESDKNPGDRGEKPRSEAQPSSVPINAGGEPRSEQQPN